MRVSTKHGEKTKNISAYKNILTIITLRRRTNRLIRLLVNQKVMNLNLINSHFGKILEELWN